MENRTNFAEKMSSEESDYSSSENESVSSEDENQLEHLVIDYVSNGDLNQLQKLSSEGTALNKIVTPQGSLLHIAVTNGQLQVAQFLLQEGCEVNAKTGFGMTSLHFAACHGKVAMVSLLLTAKDINIQAKNNDGNSPLHIAALFDHSDVVKSLIEAKADVNAQNDNGETPLHLICRIENAEETTDLLLKNHATVDIKTNDELTPMHLAIMNGNQKIIAKLQQFGSKIDPEQYFIYRQLAIIYNNDAVYKLLETEHKIQLQNNGGQSHESISIMKNMIENFIAKNPSDKKYFLPLLHAIYAYDFHQENPGDVTLPTADMSIIGIMSLEHASYILIKKLENTFEIFFCDRGLFACFDSTSNKIRPIIKTTVPADDFEKVMKKIQCICDLEDVSQFLEFFLKLKEKYNVCVLDVFQKAFKNSNCFFENLKTLILCGLIATAGNEEAIYLYKTFDKFMHESSLEIYKKISRDTCKNEVYEACMKFLTFKISKNNLLASPSNDLMPQDSLKRKFENIDDDKTEVSNKYSKKN